MTEEKQKPARTRPCPQCGKEVHAARGVCPECGYMSTWFKARVGIGCLFLGLGGLAILANIALALWGVRPE